MSINTSIETLINSWKTELNAPEILPYKEELIDEIQQLLREQDVNIDFICVCM